MQAPITRPQPDLARDVARFILGYVVSFTVSALKHWYRGEPAKAPNSAAHWLVLSSGRKRDGISTAGGSRHKRENGGFSKRSPLSCRDSFPGSDPFSDELTTDRLLNLHKSFLSLLGSRCRSSRMLFRLPQTLPRSFHLCVRFIQCTLHLLDFELGFADASR